MPLLFGESFQLQSSEAWFDDFTAAVPKTLLGCWDCCKCSQGWGLGQGRVPHSAVAIQCLPNLGVCALAYGRVWEAASPRLLCKHRKCTLIPDWKYFQHCRGPLGWLQVSLPEAGTIPPPQLRQELPGGLHHRIRCFQAHITGHFH